MKRLILLVLFITMAVAFYIYKPWFKSDLQKPFIESYNSRPSDLVNSNSAFSDFKSVNIPSQKVLPNGLHVFQSFNNCGPAALSMTLSYYGINQSQQSLGAILRPYQNPKGDNDDKSVTLSELAEQSKSYDLIPYNRPNGNVELIKAFISNDIPVITRTRLNESEDIGHYRVIKGYDDVSNHIIQDDSLQGKDLRFTYAAFNRLWKQFNYEYLVLIPSEKISIAEQILGREVNEEIAWKNSITNMQKVLSENPDDVYARFNLSVALYHAKDYKGSVAEFEKIENRLSSRDLWYQVEPIQAYFQLKDYTRVMQLTNDILNNNNRAFSELYLLRGQIYLDQGNRELAKEQFEKAVFYNKNMVEAQNLLKSINN